MNQLDPGLAGRLTNIANKWFELHGGVNLADALTEIPRGLAVDVLLHVYGPAVEVRQCLLPQDHSNTIGFFGAGNVLSTGRLLVYCSKNTSPEQKPNESFEMNHLCRVQVSIIHIFQQLNEHR